ncbi:MAG: UDP-N-acetylglucosamine 1-carboxyvinyltransferase [Christensenellaceae bacterium]|jgi:UDP-N-acetylglucosamine 1-carboxyvinyltransferase|nr:UDP-N-acetylglucosamine 1-carboxyvinyltransferase [Christensenellaceae bacterium]
MSKYVINGGKKLNGDITIHGAKNSVLPLLAASILTDETIRIGNCPNLADVENMIRILSALGVQVEREGNYIEIKSGGLFAYEIPKRQAKELRSSVFLMGSILGRMKKAKVAYPGGCDIGLRPIDIHLKALSELNVKIVEKYGYINCDATRMRAANVFLDYPSVGATENIMLLAAISDGTTTVSNAAREPEIIELQKFLNTMGAKIDGAGTSCIKIEGVQKLHGTDYYAMPDRIVTGTILMAVAMCGGNVLLNGTNYTHIDSLISKLVKSGCNIAVKSDKICIQSSDRLASMGYIETGPYPGYPTDLQAPLVALASTADGTTILVENIFENRFKHIPELCKMGANIKVKDRIAFITGVKQLTGAEVVAMDLRGGAALVLAGLSAAQLTVVHDIQHIERGYEEMDKCFVALGADVIKIN